MAIWSTLLDEKSELFGEWYSKPVHTFISVMEIYCSRSLFHSDFREEHTMVLNWFPLIIERMNEPLCLLAEANHEPWDYKENEYQQYLKEQQAEQFLSPMTQEQFINECYLSVDPWLSPKHMQNIVDELVQILNLLKLEDTWWYSEQHLIPSLQELSKELENAKRQGIRKVRFGYG